VMQDLKEYGFASAVSIRPLLYASFGGVALVEYGKDAYLGIKEGGGTIRIVQRVEAPACGAWTRLLRAPYRTLTHDSVGISTKVRAMFSALQITLGRLINFPYRASLGLKHPLDDQPVNLKVIWDDKFKQ